MPPQATTGSSRPVSAATSATIRGVRSEGAARQAAATGREPVVPDRDRVGADEPVRARPRGRAGEREHRRPPLVVDERRQLQEHRPIGVVAIDASNVSMCSGSCRHGAFGLLAFSSNPSTCGASSSTVSSAAPSLFVGDAREPRRRPRDPREDGGDRVGARVGQPHRVHDRATRRRPGDPRLRVRRPAGVAHRPAHDEPEPHAPEGVQVPARLVEARGETDRVGIRTPQSSRSSDGSAVAPPIRSHGSGSPRSAVATEWDASGGSAKNIGRATAPYHPPRPTSVCYPAVNDALVRRMVAASELHGDFVLSSGSARRCTSTSSAS